MTRQIISPADLRELLRYEPETGRLFWKAHSSRPSCWNAVFDGKQALTTIDKDGYLYGSIYGVQYRAHRAAWALHFGEWPQHHIDHINHDRKDNRISNLRDVNRLGNQRNLSKRQDNTSGVNGVGWHKQRQKWRAFAFLNGGHLSLGLYAKKEDAIAARRAFEARHEYHLNHGKLIT